MIPMKQTGQGQGTQVKVDLKDAETIRCKECNNFLWKHSFILKKINEKGGL